MFEYIVSFAIFLTYIANFPQIYKIIKTKSAKDLSRSTFFMWAFVTFVMSIHAIEINDISFMLTNIGMFVINAVIIGLTYKYR